MIHKMENKIFLKKNQQKNFFEKNIICEKIAWLCQKMMIYHKMSLSGVYENVFETSENYS